MNQLVILKICSRQYRNNSLPTLFVRANETYKGINKIIGVIEIKKNYLNHRTNDNLVIIENNNKVPLDILLKEFNIMNQKDFNLSMANVESFFEDTSILENLKDIIETDNYKLIPFNKYKI